MTRFPVSPPQNIEELTRRADSLAGKTIGEVAQLFNYAVPDTLSVKKGWQGQFIEECLGADSGNLSQPDFNHLGIELKTLPIDFSGRVLESTYVCVLNLNNHQLMRWEESPVYKKLNSVLWVPIAKQANQPTVESRIATPFLWSPSKNERQILQSDWEYVMERVSLGQVDQLNARQGEYLQVRPKAAHSRVTTKAIGGNGEMIETLPRGFYLRAQFTQNLLNYSLKLS